MEASNQVSFPPYGKADYTVYDYSLVRAVLGASWMPRFCGYVELWVSKTKQVYVYRKTRLSMTPVHRTVQERVGCHVENV